MHREDKQGILGRKFKYCRFSRTFSKYFWYENSNIYEFEKKNLELKIEFLN